MSNLKKTGMIAITFCLITGIAQADDFSGVRIEKLPLTNEIEAKFKTIPVGCCYSPYDYDDYTPYPYDYFHNTYWW